MAKAGRGQGSEGRVVKFRKPKDPSEPPILGSFDPDQMGPEFDVAHMLATRAEDFLPGSDATATSFRHFPRLCAINIDRLRASVTEREISTNSTIAACLYWGLGVLSKNDSVRDFVAMRRRFLACDKSVDPETYGVVADLFKDTGLGLGSGDRLFARLGESIYSDLSNLASSLGMNRATIAGLATFVTLAEQQSTLTAHAKDMQATLESVWRRLDLRARIIEGAIKAFNL